MAYNAKLGLPSILISFQSAASTAVIRSSRGTVGMILNDESLTNEDGVVLFNVTDSSDVPTSLSERNRDLIGKCLTGAPSQLHIFAIPPAEYYGVRSYEEEVMTEVESTTTVIQEVDEFGDDDEVTTTTETREVPTTVTITTTTIVTEATTIEATVTLEDALKQLGDLPVNYICYPTGSTRDQANLATWVKSKRKENKTYKAVVANVAADDYSVINFTTGNIRVVNPDYTDALLEAGGDSSQVPEDIPQYNSYTATEYTARLAGLFAGISLDRSSTYYTLPEVVDCSRYNEIEQHIDNGELCLFDEHDGQGVKIGRAINSLTTFTSSVGEDFRFVKIVDGLDLIADDIRRTFKNDYVGRVVNNYENKCMLISAINIYLQGLITQGVLDGGGVNEAVIDVLANKEYLVGKGRDVSDMGEEELRQANTGVNVFLAGTVTPVNAMENLKLQFTLS